MQALEYLRKHASWRVSDEHLKTFILHCAEKYDIKNFIHLFKTLKSEKFINVLKSHKTKLLRITKTGLSQVTQNMTKLYRCEDKQEREICIVKVKLSLFITFMFCYYKISF